MKKIFYVALCAAGILATTSCSDYLETSSKSSNDAEFVFSNMTTARGAMDGAYAEWHGAISSHVFGDGLFYALDIAGSDIMRHPEKYTGQPLRHVPECFYVNGTEVSTYDPIGYGKEAPDNAYSVLFSVLSKANAICTAIESTEGYEAMMQQTSPSDLSQLYGEAIAMRATVYRELIKYFGDVPFVTEMGKPAHGLTSRDSIYDVVIAQLMTVEPLMKPVGKDKRLFSQTYVDGLIGRMALEAGGYQVRRTDGTVTYTDGEGNALSFEKLAGSTSNNNAEYARRSDWGELYAIAKVYFKKAIDQSGSAKLITTDPRSADKGRVFGNPFQYFFQQLHDDDNAYADESIYEEPFSQGASGNDPRSYSLGRPSSGGGSNKYPCKAYGQGRINPAFYYGVFDPKDMRRDVACTVTASDGNGYEILIPFAPGNVGKGGGIACNKFDENRQKTVWTKNQRRSGINAPYMRMSEMYLGLAEAAAATGDEATAKQYLKIIRDRAFGGNGNVDAFIAKEGSVLKAVIDERGFEFAGEGDRRFTLIRTGLLPEKIKYIKDLQIAMINGLKTNGYYTFENGNTISMYVYTKLVDLKAEKGYRLTAQCPAGQESNPVLYPSWRGQNDDWDAFRLANQPSGSPLYTGANGTKTNLAIVGLFKQVSAADEAALLADGYTKVAWGKGLVDNEAEYTTYLFNQYDYTKAPIYLFPFSPNVMSAGGFTNGYGFVQADK